MNVNRNLGKESANEQTVNYTMEESLNKTLQNKINQIAGIMYKQKQQLKN